MNNFFYVRLIVRMIPVVRPFGDESCSRTPASYAAAVFVGALLALWEAGYPAGIPMLLLLMVGLIAIDREGVKSATQA